MDTLERASISDNSSFMYKNSTLSKDWRLSDGRPHRHFSCKGWTKRRNARDQGYEQDVAKNK